MLVTKNEPHFSFHILFIVWETRDVNKHKLECRLSKHFSASTFFEQFHVFSLKQFDSYSSSDRSL